MNKAINNNSPHIQSIMKNLFFNMSIVNLLNKNMINSDNKNSLINTFNTLYANKHKRSLKTVKSKIDIKD